MKIVLIANIVGLSLALITIVGLGILLWRAEKKLAKHDESWMFKRK